MTERPILMSGPMVRAILAGRKSQTRRVIKPQPRKDGAGPGWSWDHHKNSSQLYRGEPVREQMLIHAPYRVGMRLWVREAFMRAGVKSDHYRYRADFPGSDPPAPTALAWRPSIFMPRAACRILLEVTGVRVERVQEIMEEDAVAEGSCIRHEEIPEHGMTGNPPSPRDCFRAMWDALNAKRRPPGKLRKRATGYGWAANPWVWVVSFKRVV